MTRMPRACAASISRMYASSPPSSGSTRSEARRVVAVVGCGGEHRRQVQQVRRRARRGGRACRSRRRGRRRRTAASAPGIDRVDRVVPLRRDRPRPASGARRPAAERANRSGNTWYITASYSQAGGAGYATSAKSSASSVSMRVEPALVQPLDATARVLEHPAVAVARVADDDVGLPPVPAVRRADEGGIRPLRLVVGIRAGADGRERAVPGGHAERARAPSHRAPGARFETYSGEPSW